MVVKMITTDATNEQERLALREERGLRLISEAEEGVGIAKLSGVPQASRKLTDGEAHVIGYVNPDESAGIESGSIDEFQLFPAPFQEAIRLVSIDMGRIGTHKVPLTDGNPVNLTTY